MRRLAASARIRSESKGNARLRKLHRRLKPLNKKENADSLKQFAFLMNHASGPVVRMTRGSLSPLRAVRGKTAAQNRAAPSAGVKVWPSYAGTLPLLARKTPDDRSEPLIRESRHDQRRPRQQLEREAQQVPSGVRIPAKGGHPDARAHPSGTSGDVPRAERPGPAAGQRQGGV